MTKEQTERVQRLSNAFTKEHLRSVTPLIVDGDKGHATNVRIKQDKRWLGYEGKIDATVDDDFLWRLEHPLKAKEGVQGKPALKRGQERRDEQHKRVRENEQAAKTHGVGTFDGKPCANVAIRILQWCRDHGWQGQLVSGWRDPEYSESLCIAMCGAPSCPGRCAGKASNHVGDSPERFAVDVSDYVNFGQVVAGCPLEPRIFNALPIDPVHYSPNGR